jgi:hypothetical protein
MQEPLNSNPPTAAAGAAPAPAAGPQAPPNAAVWYVGKAGQQLGPFDFFQVVAGIQNGTFLAADFCWRAGMATWTPLGSLPEFAPYARRSPTPGQAAVQLQAGVERAKQATFGAFEALRIFAFNPVGGLPLAYRAVGKTGALSAGIVFLVAYEVLLVIAARQLMGSFMADLGPKMSIPISMYLRAALVFAVPFAAVALSLAGIRLVARSDETFHADVFVAGIVMLAFGVVALVAGLAGTLNPEIMVALIVLVQCYIVLLLFSAVTRIHGIGEAPATLCVPGIILLAAWLTSVIVRALLPRMLGLGDMGDLDKMGGMGGLGGPGNPFR